MIPNISGSQRASRALYELQNAESNGFVYSCIIVVTDTPFKSSSFARYSWVSSK